METFLATLFILVCVLLIVVVLLQKGRGGGLGAAFGGLGSSAFGTRVGDVLTWVTIVLTAVFLLLAVLTSMTWRPDSGTVEMPSFSPPADRRYADDVYVRISTGTPKARIYYTLDGSEPTEKSRPNPDSTIRLSVSRTEGVTIKARAFKPGWTPSPVATSYYGPDWTADTQAAPATEPAPLPQTQPDEPAATQTQPAATGADAE